MKKKSLTLKQTSDSLLKENLEAELRRTPTSLRLATSLKIILIELSEKIGLPVSNILETAVTEYLFNRNSLISQKTEERKQDQIWEQLGRLNSEQLFKLLSIHLRLTGESYDFTEDTGIDCEAKSFKYFNSTALLQIFKSYFEAKKLGIPKMEDLIKNASEGFSVPWVGIARKYIRLTDKEIQEILLVCTIQNSSTAHT